MADFCAGLGPLLEKQGVAGRQAGREPLAQVAFDCLGQPLLACHTGDASHRVHIDNPHEEGGLPDNGMRRWALSKLRPDARRLVHLLHQSPLES